MNILRKMVPPTTNIEPSIRGIVILSSDLIKKYENNSTKRGDVARKGSTTTTRDILSARYLRPCMAEVIKPAITKRFRSLTLEPKGKKFFLLVKRKYPTIVTKAVRNLIDNPINTGTPSDNPILARGASRPKNNMDPKGYNIFSDGAQPNPVLEFSLLPISFIINMIPDTIIKIPATCPAVICSPRKDMARAVATRG
jgi:hypothetical protein